MGLDQPLLVQYGHWLWNVLHGNLGTSYNFEESVLSQLARKLPYTLALAGAAFLLDGGGFAAFGGGWRRSSGIS